MSSSGSAQFWSAAALRADPVCCFLEELAINFFVQSFMLPCCAVAFNDFSGANIGVGFRSVITDTHSYIFMERANHCRARGRQRVSNDRSEIVGPVIDGHKRQPVGDVSGHVNVQ